MAFTTTFTAYERVGHSGSGRSRPGGGSRAGLGGPAEACDPPAAEGAAEGAAVASASTSASASANANANANAGAVVPVPPAGAVGRLSAADAVTHAPAVDTVRRLPAAGATQAGRPGRSGPDLSLPA